MGNRCFNSLISVVPIIAAMLLSPHLLADETSDMNLLSMDMETLTELHVVSASRQEQKLSEVSVPITIITAEDIHYSGATTIPEILQFAPGVDVRRLDRQRYIVGVRGLFAEQSDRTLVLIDGRPTLDLIHGTVHWSELPVLIEDIERIEIARGPAGATWGSNAFNGAINIITKTPEQSLGGQISTTISEFADFYTYLRYGQAKGNWSWKASGGYEQMQDSDDAGAGRNIWFGVNGHNNDDWARRWKFDIRAEYRADEQTKFNLGASHTSSKDGGHDYMYSLSTRGFLTEYTRAFFRLDHQFNEDTSGYIQWFGNFWNTHRRVITEQMRYMENDIEGQLNFKPAEKHYVSIGGNLRWNQIQTSNYASTFESIFGDTDEYWAGMFLMDRWTVTERLTLEGQFRLDHFNETTTDWSTRVSALYALDEQKNHILRASYARSFRSPCLVFRNLYWNGIWSQLAQRHNVYNEGTYSLELGYSGKLSENLQVNVDSYYQRYSHLLGWVSTVEGFNLISSFKNQGGANAYGAECSVTYRNKKGILTAWYAYNGFRTDQTDQITRSILPADNKAGLTWRLYLDDNWTFNTNCTVQNNCKGTPQVIRNIPSFDRLDITLTRKFAKGKGEITFGVSDLLNKTTDYVYDMAHFTATETPGRMFFGRLQFYF